MMLPIFVSLLVLILAKECSSQSAPAVFVFGDSLTDAGNNNWYALPAARANWPPYGMNFPTGVTGRVTNGRTFPDLIATELGLPFPRPYRLPIRPITTTGYTYASAGCGILQETGQLLGCMSFDEQIGKFRETIDEVLRPAFPNPIELSEYLSKSIFIIWGGSNDYLLNYFMGRSPNYSPQDFAKHVVDKLSNQLKVIHDMGARKFVVLEVGPLGCVPLYRENGGHNDTWCDESKNKNATIFNSELNSMVQNLSSTYLDSRFTFGEIYSLSDDVFKNPSKYGMRDVSHSCCRTGPLNISCAFINPQACDTPNEYLFFDGAHPTEAAYRILASQCFNGSGVCVPHNINQLAQLQVNSPHFYSAA